MGHGGEVTDERVYLASCVPVVDIAVCLGFADDECDRIGLASSDDVRAVAADLRGNRVAGGGRNIRGHAEAWVTLLDRACGHEN